jgi:small-conductance mechanosensitive channel
MMAIHSCDISQSEMKQCDRSAIVHATLEKAFQLTGNNRKGPFVHMPVATSKKVEGLRESHESLVDRVCADMDSSKLAPPPGTIVNLILESVAVAITMTLPAFFILLTTRSINLRYPVHIWRIGQPVDPTWPPKSGPVEFARFTTFAATSYIAYTVIRIVLYLIPSYVAWIVEIFEGSVSHGVSPRHNRTVMWWRRTMHHLYAAKDSIAMVGLSLVMLSFGRSMIYYVSSEDHFSAGIPIRVSSTAEIIDSALFLTIFLTSSYAIAKFLEEMITFRFLAKAYSKRIAASNKALGVLRRIYGGVCRGPLLERDRELDTVAGDILDESRHGGSILSRMGRTAPKGDLDTYEGCQELGSVLFAGLSDDKGVVSAAAVEVFFDTAEKDHALQVFGLNPQREHADSDGPAPAEMVLEEGDVQDVVLSVSEERAALRASVRTTGQIIDSLRSALFVGVIVLAFVYAMVRLGLSNLSLIIGIGVVAAALVMLLGRGLQRMVSGMIYIFGHHFYDVGDKVIVGDWGLNRKAKCAKGVVPKSIQSILGRVMSVRDIRIHTTKFECDDGSIAVCGHEELVDIPIFNLSRSAELFVAIEGSVQSSAGIETAKALRNAMADICGQSPREYTGCVLLERADVCLSDGILKIRLLVELADAQCDMRVRAKCTKMLESYLSKLTGVADSNE